MKIPNNNDPLNEKKDFVIAGILAGVLLLFALVKHKFNLYADPSKHPLNKNDFISGQTSYVILQKKGQFDNAPFAMLHKPSPLTQEQIDTKKRQKAKEIYDAIRGGGQLPPPQALPVPQVPPAPPAN